MQCVDDLFVIASAERCNNKPLGFPAGEQRRAMCPRQQAGVDLDLADLIQAATINPASVFHNVSAQDNGFELFEGGAEVGIGKLIFGQTRKDRFFCCPNRRHTLLLVRDRIGGAHLLFACTADRFEQFRIVRCLKIEWFFCGVFGQVNDQVQNALDLLMGKGDGAQHFLFGQLVGLRFDHHDRALGACNHKIQTLIGVIAQILHVVDFRVQDVFSVGVSDAASGDRSHEGNA